MRAVPSSSFSVLLHLCLLTGLAAASAMRVMPLPEHGWRLPAGIVYLAAGPTGAPGTPASTLPAAASRRQRGAPRVIQPVEPARPAAPETTAPPSVMPPEVPAPDVAAGEAADDSGGSAGGVPGGSDDGSADGVPGGMGGAGGAGGPGGAGSGPASGGPAPREDDDALYFDGTITLPVAVHRVEPIYPPAARMARLEATLRFQIVVDRDGDVIEVRPLASHPVFERSAVEALRQWKYRPATQAGRPVKVYLLVTVEFKLIG